MNAAEHGNAREYIQYGVTHAIPETIMSATPSQDAPTRTLNVRVPQALYQQLEHLAKATARTKSFVALEALRDYLQAQSWQVQDIQSGLVEADRGDFASDAEVDAVLARYGA